MPQVVYNKTKGLVQSTGNGFNLEGETAGYGRHVLVEEIELTPANATCAGVLTRYLPVGAVLLSTSLTVSGKGTSASQTYILNVHSAAIAVGAAVGSSTELIGAGASATTIPNGADLDFGSAGGVVLGDSILNDTAIDRAGDASYFMIFNSGNNSADTGTPKASVVVEWVGGPSVAA